MIEGLVKVQVLDKGFVELVNSVGNDKTIVDAARVSFGKDNDKPFDTEKDPKLIRYMLKNGHTSPFEHVLFTFVVKCPLFVRSQWHRHRTWSYNEISRRYTSDDIEFYIPTSFRKQSENNKQASTEETIEVVTSFILDDSVWTAPVNVLLENYSNSALSFYNQLLDDGVAREQARMVLPQNMYTRFYATVDLHNLFHFLELRNSEHAQYEIRLYAQAIEKLVEPIIPETFKIWKELKHGNV